MSVTTEQATMVGLERDCGDLFCEEHASVLYAQLAGGRYDWCSVMPLPGSLDEWRETRRTARKRVDRCRRRGYRFNVLALENHSDALYAINTSKERRQGRVMTDSYRVPPAHSPLPHFPCARHAIRPYGVWSESGELAAYIVLYRSGDLVLVSQIMGHVIHEENEVMFLLFAGALEQETHIQPGTVIYNRWDSGEQGLRDFKSRLGFEERLVQWLP